MCSDLFCAFQPKRVMVPSLPLRLNAPPTPKLLLRLAARFFNRVESSRFSISPAPKTGVGIRKMMLSAALAPSKFGCVRLQAPASERPVTVNRSSTPPLGAFRLAEPSALKKNGNRASRVGPWALMKNGVVSAGATPLLVNWNWGLTAAPVPPTAGCAWHDTQLLALKRGPRPLLPLGLLETDSTAWKRFWPFSKKARIPGLSSTSTEGSAA